MTFISKNKVHSDCLNPANETIARQVGVFFKKNAFVKVIDF